MTIVLDAWALIAHLRNEPAAERVRSAWIGTGAAMCSINLGEALYQEMRVRGAERGSRVLENSRRALIVVDPDWELVKVAAAIKVGGGLSYADAFCIATAAWMRAPLLTGDPEIIDRAAAHRVEVVDLRS